MRQLLSTALVALIVAALTAVTVSAVAQSPAQPPVSTTALNADTVDGLSAVKATNKKKARANRLVATDAKGFLPSNIVKSKWGLITGKPAVLADGQISWGEVTNKPGDLADGQISWGEVQGIPAGFADNVDNEGVTGVTLTRVIGTGQDIPAGEPGGAYASCPAGSKVTGGAFFLPESREDFVPSLSVSTLDSSGWVVDGWNNGTVQVTLYPVAHCLSVQPAGAFTTAKKGVVPASVKKAMKNRDR